jgi:hypothetical protein
MNKPTATRGSFAANVDAALTAWLTEDARTELMALAKLLGCAHAGAELRTEPITTDDERVIQKTWITLLHESVPNSGLPATVERHTLCGLLTNDRWRTLMAEESSAHAFVLMAASFLQRRSLETTNPRACFGVQQKLIRVQLGDALAKWLPGQDAVATERDLFAAFFGEAWCAVVYDSLGPSVDLEQFLETTRPPFLPGRLTIDDTKLVEILPSLD